MTVERYRAFGLEIASEIELSVFAPGRSNEVDVEIVAGLAVGQSYVVEGAFTLKAQLAKGSFGDGHSH